MTERRFLTRGLRIVVQLPDDTPTVVCPKCDGAGRMTATSWLNRFVATFDEHPCPQCDGKGMIYEIRLPAGQS
jgi:DnaJ-class molecular chaperone